MLSRDLIKVHCMNRATGLQVYIASHVLLLQAQQKQKFIWLNSGHTHVQSLLVLTASTQHALSLINMHLQGRDSSVHGA